MSIRALVGNYLDGRALDTFILWYKIYRKDLLEVGSNKTIPDMDERNIQTSISKFIIENGGRLVMKNNDLEFKLNMLNPNDETWMRIVKLFNDQFNQWDSMILEKDDLVVTHKKQSKTTRSSRKFSCYEIHRANMPAKGCTKQCDECKAKEYEW